MSDEFLQNPPQGLDLRQRITFEGLGFAIDSMQIGLERLRRTALQLAKAMPDVVGFKTAPLFVDAWSMIDQAYAISQLIGSLRGMIETKETKAFVEKNEAAILMRNRMDHLADNLSNLTDTKLALPTVFGALSFVAISNVEEGKIKAASLITATAGSIIRDSHRFAVPNPLGQELEAPVGFFHLQAFGFVQNLSELSKDAERLRAEFSADVAEYARKVLIEECEKQGLDPKNALSPAAAGLVTSLEVSF